MFKDPREIQELEELCVADHAPDCIAACPVHVDVKSMIEQVQKGNFTKASEILQKSVIFAGIIGHICDHPCELECKYNKIGDPIKISAIEQASVTYGDLAPFKPKVFIRKKQKIAIIGGGLSGMSAALKLAQKGYPVVIIEASDRLGGRIWDIPDSKLPKDIVKKETEIIPKSGIEVRFNTVVDSEDKLSQLFEEFHVAYLAIGQQNCKDLGLKQKDGKLVINPISLETSREGVFAGGSIRRPKGDHSPINSIADGYRAALSLERFIQKVSLTASRDQEGPYETKLYTKFIGLEPTPAVKPADPEAGYTKEEAIAEAKRCLQCACMECVKNCVILQEFEEYPGKCLRSIAKNLIIHPGMGLRSATKFINACNLCSLCAEMCPNGLNMATVNQSARAIMYGKGYMPLAIHDFPIRDMQFSNSEKCALTRNQPGTDTSKYAFFPGCQLTASSPNNVEKVYEYLIDKLPGGVGLILNCCGAPAAWAGRMDVFEEQLQVIKDSWEALGKPQVILGCPTCYKMFKENLKEIPIKFLTQVLLETGLPKEAQKGNGKKLAIQDACTARDFSAIHDSIRKITKQLGYEVEELSFSKELTKCCGYGGLLYNVNPELTQKVIKSRISESPEDFLAYCANCRDFFVKEGKPTYHILDILFDKEPDAERKGPGYSQRHENRVRLKNKLLQELWGENVQEYNDYTKIKLNIPQEVQEKMEKNFILVEDIQQVIEHAEKTGNKLLNRSNGHFIAHFRPKIITYWVEYSVEDDEYNIYNVYSHRIQIVEDEE